MTPQSRRIPVRSAVALALLAPCLAHASFFKGEALDTMADVMSWVVLVIVPVVAISVFWLVHILPEKVAEKRHHPQAEAIQVLCLLSLFFGGLLWPLAWLWAYSKPVMYKLAYGTDKVVHAPEMPPLEPIPEHRGSSCRWREKEPDPWKSSSSASTRSSSG